MALLRSLAQFQASHARSTIPISTALRSSALFIVSRREKNDANVPDVNVVAPFHDSINQPEKGKVYDKKPFKFMAEKGRPYMWCSCGQSKTQPLCDGTHKNQFLKIKLRPVRFIIEETKEVWLCNCKQTNKRPFCDGTHRNEEVKSQIKN